MAFTTAERADVRFRLGWSARFHQFDSRLEQAMNAIDSGLTDEETLIRTELTSCTTVDTELDAAHSRLKALKVGSIGLSGYGEISALRREGARHTKRIASILGVERRANVYSSSSESGFASFSGSVGGGNAIMKG